jgi:hypothetical protein
MKVLVKQFLDFYANFDITSRLTTTFLVSLLKYVKFLDGFFTSRRVSHRYVCM